MRVLYIARGVPPLLGGMERYSADLIVSGSADAFFSITNHRSKAHLLWWVPFAWIQAWFTIRRGSVDLVHVTDALLAPFFVPLAKFMKIPIVVTAHALDVLWPMAIYQRSLRIALPKADAVVAVSQGTAQACRDRGVAPERLVVIPNGIHPPIPIDRQTAREYVSEKYGVAKTAFVLVSVGRLIPRKNLFWFVRHVMPRLHEDVVLLAIGDGPERANIEQAIVETSMVRRVVLAGRVSDEVRNIVYSAGDLFVMPNRSVPGDAEGFGIVNIEAASCGLPVVASRIEGITEAVQEGENGRLIPQGDADAFINVISRYQADTEALRALSHKARAYTVAKFDWRTLAVRYRELYSKIVQNRRPISAADDKIVCLFLVKFEPTTGKSKHILEVSRRLADRGITTHLITNKVKWNGSADALAHLKIHELGGSTNGLYLRPGKVAAAVRSTGAGVFELHGGLSMTLFARSFAKRIPVPVVVNIHSQPSDLLNEWRHLSWADWVHDRKYVADLDDLIGLTMKAVGLKRFVSQPNIKSVIVPSQQLAVKLKGVLNASYIPSGARINSRDSADTNRDSRNPTILFFGRAVMVRGIDTLIQAFNKLGITRPDLRLALLLLDDVDLNRVRKLVKDSPWSTRIELTVGRQADMDQRLTRATLAAFPFRSSGCIPEQPLTMIEAMAAGLPVVTTPIGTVPEIVQDGQNGRIVPPADPKRLAQVLGELLDDSVTRDRLGLAGQETVRTRFNWDKIADQTLRIYEQACKRA